MCCWRYRILILVVTLISLHGKGQFSREFSFKNYSVLNGLASNAVRDVAQDKDGYIWVATTNGLQRFDGSSFITYNEAIAGSPSIEEIWRFLIDSKNRMWAITHRYEVGLISTKKVRFNPIHLEGEYPQRFFETVDHKILVLTNQGFYRYNESSKTFVHDKQTLPLPKNWRPNHLTFDKTSASYWISCDSGLVNFNPATRELSYRGHNPSNNPVISAFAKYLSPFSVFADRNGNIIFNRWPHLSGTGIFYRFHKTSGQIDSLHFVNQLGYHELKGMLEQRRGRLWLYGLSFLGEWPINQKTLNLIPNEYKNEQSIKYDYIYNAVEDREHNIWLATDNGLFYFNPDDQIFDSYKLVRADGKPSLEANVHSMITLDNGNILVGCWGTGFFYYDKNFRPLPLPKGLRDKTYFTSVWDMAIHPKTRDVWITLQGGGLLVYNQKKDSYREFFPDVFDRATIRQIDEDTSGNMWLGSHRGHLVKWDYKKSGGDPMRGYELVAKTGLIMKVHYDYAGYVYVASIGNGLLKFDAKTKRLVKLFTDKGGDGERLFNNNPNDMTYYNDSTLIVSAGCINILNTRTGKIEFFSKADGLPFNGTESVERDRNGIVWVGMTNGICRLNLQKKLLTYYDRRDGIPYDKFSPTGVKEMNDGRIAFFTDHNFLVFDPQRFVSVKKPPKPVLTSFLLMGQLLPIDSLLMKKSVVLPYDKNSIEIGFSTLSYLPQRKLHYYYKLEPLDKEWIRGDKPMRAVYNYLPDGDYIFKVKTVNADGMTNDEELSFPVTVRPPFWKTWWFLSLLALAIITILYLLDRERMNKLRSMQMLRRQIRGNLKEEVSITLNNINVLSEMAKIKADKNVDQAKGFIDQISEKSRSMMQVMDDTLWTIDPQNDSMSQTLLRISETTEAVMAAHQVDIDLMVDKKTQLLELDMKLRHDFFFFYKEALQFIISELHAQQVFVNINLVRSKLMLEILTESPMPLHHVESQFIDAVDKRVKQMPATLDLLIEGQSFSALLYVQVRK